LEVVKNIRKAVHDVEDSPAEMYTDAM